MKANVVSPLFGCWISLLAGMGCSLVVDTSVPSACITGEECGAGGVCRADGTCGLALTPSCTDNTQCRQEQRGDYCVNAVCIPNPITEACPEVYPRNALEIDDNKLLFGFIGAVDFAAGQADTSYGRPPLEGVMYALEEFDSGGGGIPGVGTGQRRNLAVLACTENGPEGDLGHPARVAQHLVEVARVPVIIGASTSGNTLRVWEQFVRTQSMAVLVSPSATSPEITEQSRRDTLDPENRLWRTAPSDKVQAALLRSLALDVRTTIDPSNTRSAVFFKADPAGNGLVDALNEAGLNEDFPDRIEYVRYPERTQDWTEDYAGRVLDEPLPNIIIALGTEEFVLDLLPQIEERWPTTSARPWYVLPEGGRHASLAEYAMTHPELELGKRVVGTAPGARKSTYYKTFATYFQSQFNHSPGNLAEFGYDAAYALVFAVARANATYPSGLQLAVALNELACKEEGSVSISPGTIAFGTNFLSATHGDCIDLEGASGFLDFDENGEAVSDIGTWCLRRQGARTTVDLPLEHYYEALSGQRLGPLDLTDPDWCVPAP
jgi:ABC-type branched-subunit amino acid transport system substrate-binding protein